jgi:hypothetical protein
MILIPYPYTSGHSQGSGRVGHSDEQNGCDFVNLDWIYLCNMTGHAHWLHVQ